jgi:CheY-like chemotaxis protein
MSTVLVVEHDADIRGAMARIFARVGHYVVAVVDGLGARDQAGRSLPDLVVLDVAATQARPGVVPRAADPIRRRPPVAILVVSAWARPRGRQATRGGQRPRTGATKSTSRLRSSAFRLMFAVRGAGVGPVRKRRWPGASGSGKRK